MRPTLRIALLLVAVAASAPPIARAAEPTLEGIYGAEGINPDGSPYRGVVKIIRRGESFLVAWLFGAQVDETTVLVPTSAGVGITGGSTLAVSYYGQDMTGVILYQIEKGGQRLIGRWAPANGEGAVHSETLTKLTTPTVVPDTDTPVPPPLKKPVRTAISRTVSASR